MLSAYRREGVREMAYFKVVLKGGHMGAGKSYDLVRYCEARDIFSAYRGALSLSRVKKNPNGTSIYSVEMVPLDEYFRGKGREKQDPYLNYRPRAMRSACTSRK
jgi:hypothetical protein